MKKNSFKSSSSFISQFSKNCMSATSMKQKMGTAILTALQNLSAQSQLEEFSTGWKMGLLITPSKTITTPITWSNLALGNGYTGTYNTYITTSENSISASSVPAYTRYGTGTLIHSELIPFTSESPKTLFAFQLKSTSGNITTASDSVNNTYNVFNANFQVYNKLSVNTTVNALTSFGTLYLGNVGMSPLMIPLGYNVLHGEDRYTREKYDGEWYYTFYNYGCMIYYVSIGLSDKGITVKISGCRLTLPDTTYPKTPESVSVNIPAFSIPYWHL